MIKLLKNLTTTLLFVLLISSVCTADLVVLSEMDMKDSAVESGLCVVEQPEPCSTDPEVEEALTAEARALDQITVAMSKKTSDQDLSGQVDVKQAMAISEQISNHQQDIQTNERVSELINAFQSAAFDYAAFLQNHSFKNP